MAKMFTTPTVIPEGLACRTLKIPNDGIWLGIFNQVLLETLNPYNWEQTYPEDMTIEDTIAVCQEIINLYWIAENCPDADNCVQPAGYRVLRLNLNGYIEQLSAGAWTAPDGDYEIPPTTAREEPTASERKCLAAANAQNVLEQTYEQVTDAIAEGLTVAELAVIMATELTLLLGPMFGFIVPAFIFLLEAAALAFIEIAEFMATDVWDAEFSDLLLCALLECATDTDDVVTFDYQCVIDGLAKNVDLLNPLAQAQLLLFGQVHFMLSIIGADGLNLAGATTEVEAEDCAECDASWCYEWDFTLSNGGWVVRPDFAYGEWISGRGWVSQYYSPVDSEALGAQITITIPTGESTIVTQINTWQNLNAFSPGNKGIEIYKNGTWVIGANGNNNGPGADFLYTTDLATEWLAGDTMMIRVYGSTGIGYGTSNEIDDTRVLLRGSGYNPFGESNCEE